VKDFMRRHIDANVGTVGFFGKVEQDKVERFWLIHDSRQLFFFP
jgi:hypothetical protein